MWQFGRVIATVATENRGTEVDGMLHCDTQTSGAQPKSRGFKFRGAGRWLEARKQFRARPVREPARPEMEGNVLRL
jgi:hypothetical protein